MNYLIYSNSYRLLNDEINKILKGITNISKYDLLFDELDNILEEASYFSLFEEKKAIIVRNAQCFTKSKEKYDEEKLLKYLKDPNPNTILIFITNNSVDKTKEITKEIKNSLIEIKIPIYKEIENIIKNIFTKNKYIIDYSDITYIVAASLKNYDLAMNNVDKILMYYDEPCKITHDDVVNLTSNTLEDNNFKFIEAVTDKNIKESLKILNDLVVFKEDLITLNATLINEFKNILKTVSYKESGYSLKEIEKKLNKKDWQINKYLTKSIKYRKNELSNKLKDLLELDYAFKNGKVNPKTGLELFILGM